MAIENIRPIRNEADYDWALGEIEHYFNDQPREGTPEADRYDILTALISAYEAEHHAIDDSDPIDAIRCVLEDRGMKQSDLAELVGGRGRASEIMNRRRALTLPMIRRISDSLGLPADILVRPYRLANEGRPSRALPIAANHDR